MTETEQEVLTEWSEVVQARLYVMSVQDGAEGNEEHEGSEEQ